jgi:hypothetical protein
MKDCNTMKLGWLMEISPGISPDEIFYDDGESSWTIDSQQSVHFPWTGCMEC